MTKLCVCVCVTKSCVTKMCEREVACERDVCERLCVCDKVDKVVCVRERDVCEKVVRERVV